MKTLFRHILYALAIILLISLFNMLFYYQINGEFPSWRTSFTNFGWTAYFTLGLYAVNAPMSLWVQNIFVGYGWKKIIYRLLIGSLGSAIVTLFAGSFLYVLAQVMRGKSWHDAMNWLFSQNSIQSIQILVWIALSIAITFQVIFLIQNYQSNKLKEQKQKVIRISTQHESLKSQISSHFLFNSLNVLNGLIDEDPAKAQEFVSELSSIYRYVLEQKDKTLVSLREEMEFSKTYMQLIQKRYEDGLEFEIEKDIPESFQIVPLSLQILIENCIKHNRISSEEPLRIKVELENGRLVVRNNLQEKKHSQKTTGKGLDHIISNFENFTREKVDILQSDREFTVKLPLITENIQTMETQQKYTDEEYKAAKKRVEEVQGFYWNLTSYVVVNAFLTFLDFQDNGSYDWAYWPLIGWGIGITFHAIEVFGLFNSTHWKDDMIRKELEKRKTERDNFKY